jgi:DNA polymerase-3 subunit alpha
MSHDSTLDAVILEASPEHQKLLRHWVKQGWKFRKRENPSFAEDLKKQGFKAYKERLDYELGQIQSKGFDSYFLMLSDAVRWAKDNRIPVGPARGSAAASLVAYLLRITEINPMQFPTMLFARFIDPNRLDLPDVDLDFADDRRDEVRKYLVDKYGSDRVGNIGNFTRYRGKNAIDDIARVYRIPKWAAEGVKGLIVERSGGDARQSESLADTFEMFDKAKEFAEQFPELRKAELLEGNYRGLGVHAAGIVISNTPIEETCAVYTRPKAGSDEPVSVVAYDKKDSEYVGLLKADFLGLTTMGMIGRALDMIGMELQDLYKIPITEEKTLQAFSDNNLIGIFQFEGRATAIVNRDVGPENFSHLADINALSRPGPLFSGMTAKYVAVKHGREEPERLHPVVDALTDWTYGQIVYQEQVLSIVKDLAGFPIERVGDIRRIISQKLGQMAMSNALEEFIEGCRTTHGIKPELSRRIWDFIATSSTYSFNQSHSVGYAMLAFWSMYLKVNYPKEFYAASLSKISNGKGDLWKRSRMIVDAQKNNIQVLPPRLLESGASWTISDDGILGGFEQVHGIGEKTAENILKYREDAEALGVPIKEWSNLTAVRGIGDKTIEKIKAFVESDDPYQVGRVKGILEAAREAISEMDLVQPTHHSTNIPQTGTHEVVWVGMVRDMNYKDYVEATRTRTGRDEDEIIATMKDPDLRKSCVLQCYDEGDEDVYVRISRWNFPDLELDLESVVKNQDVILVTGKKREDFGISIHTSDLAVLKLQE